MPDARTIDSFRFGLEWEPKLAEMMLRFPWPDSAFVAGDPSAVCKVCSKGKTADVHVAVAPTVGDSRDQHVFEPSPPFSEEKIASARDEWRRRMANLPTPEAESAWKGVHEERFKRLKALFAVCGVKTREDIELLGCTGCAALGLSLDDIKFFRLGLAGSGVGLPCFVPPDRYCLAHEVSGGLQDGQEKRFVEGVEQVARPLTPAEQAHAKLVQAARKSEREHGAHSLLHGHTLPAGWQEMDGAEGGAQVETFAEAVEGLRAEGGIDDVVEAGSMRKPLLLQWVCDVHAKTDWTCRHCVAQTVVEGELVPVLEVCGAVNQADPTVEGIVAAANTQNVDHLEVWARVATFTRKLARD